MRGRREGRGGRGGWGCLEGDEVVFGVGVCVYPTRRMLRLASLHPPTRRRCMRSLHTLTQATLEGTLYYMRYLFGFSDLVYCLLGSDVHCVIVLGLFFCIVCFPAVPLFHSCSLLPFSLFILAVAPPTNLLCFPRLVSLCCVLSVFFFPLSRPGRLISAVSS